MSPDKLAINGGAKVRNDPLPHRKLFGDDELGMVTRVFQDSWNQGIDFGFQGKYENLYTEKFCEFQGGGYADAVCSGTAAIYLALKSLDVEQGSDVIVSPVTDPGSVGPVVLAGMKLVVADSLPHSFNTGPDQFEEALTPNTRAAILTHTGGYPVDMEPIVDIAKSRNIRIVEDCSQAHGALYRGKRVGRFGNIGVFSTMFSKNHATGGCGGLVYTGEERYYWRIRSLADRGKPFSDPDFDPRNPAEFVAPALNLNLDELSCAIGLSTLSRLQQTIDSRLAIADRIDAGLKQSSVVSPCERRPDCKPSLFFHTVEVAVDKIRVSKEQFAEAVGAEGVWINPDYRYVVAEWKWVQKYLQSNHETNNATAFRNRTFNILFNERFGNKEVDDIVESILKVESCYGR